MNESCLIRITEVSQRLGVSIKTIYAWVHLQRIPHVKVGRLVRFDWSDIEEWLRVRKVPTIKY